MGRIRAATLAMILAAVLAADARAEKTVTISVPDTGVFDQPSTAVSGSTAHVAYIGADNTAGPFRVFYAAVNGGANFADLSLTRDTAGFLVTAPTAIDNAAPGNDAYADARHPTIAMRSATEAVLFFQAKPAVSPDNTFVLYMATVTLDNNAVVRQTVRMVVGVAGFNEDVSVALVTADNTARIAYAGRNGLADRFDVFYARVSLETAAVTGSPGVPLLLSGAAGTDGVRPIPSLKLDGLNRAHIAWAANNDSAGANAVYYALVKGAGGAGNDNVAIAATEVPLPAKRWGHPNLLVSTPQAIIVLAADESTPGVAGVLGAVTFNPDADDQDGDPVEIPTNTSFVATPPGGVILGNEFSLYRPEAFRDVLGNIHMTGYGNNGRSTYYAFTPSSTSPFGQFVTSPATVGLDSPDLPVSLPGDYSRAAIGFLSGKALVFWSGRTPGEATANLDVIGIPTSSAVPFEESGCAAAPRPAGDAAAGALLLLLPAVLCAIRRGIRRCVAP